MVPLRVAAVLSLTGPHERFGSQAARALQLWAEWDAGVVLEVMDDGGSPERAAGATHEIASRADVLLGPYSTVLAHAAARAVSEDGGLLWNHGGSGTHVERDHPGHVVSVLTPTPRYADPFLTWFAATPTPTVLWIAEGTGRFARQVARGAATGCDRAGLEYRPVRSAQLIRGQAVRPPWSLFSAGSPVEDAEVANWAAASASSPRALCAVGAGVHGFREAVSRHQGVLGVAQWVAGGGTAVRIGPAESAFLDAYRHRWSEPLDYPGVQAVAGAVIATHCARTAGETTREALWNVASRLRTTTMFGDFEIDPGSGEQVGHRMVLVRWGADSMAPV